ncbi:hypothetical protein MKW94_016067 [Papaver nudicaule]|uniref:Uncharacterized protein n=1 Tax=Papaver nudicaule TaxID=74823 RepID=A0AA41RVM4_PAPNU|nr:hypothetical protein [Papaver nudicaule]
MEKPASSSYKPHFPEPTLPGSSSAHGLVTTLKSTLKSWKVTLNDFKLREGWAEFFKAHEPSLPETKWNSQSVLLESN